MSVTDWVGVVGLAVAVFSTAWTVISGTKMAVQRSVWSAAIALASVLAVGISYAIEKGSDRYLQGVMREDIIAFVGGPSRYFWTFDDLLAAEEDKHPGLAAVRPLRPILQEVLFQLTEERKMKSWLALWRYSSPPEMHCVRVFCKDCEMPPC
jgi:hypothetical protein